MFAVIKTGGKQYKVSQGDTLDIERLSLPEEETREANISEVLLLSDGEKTRVGQPFVEGASVQLEILEEVRAKKVVAYKFRRREGYHRTVGHRQRHHRVKVKAITA